MKRTLSCLLLGICLTLTACSTPPLPGATAQPTPLPVVPAYLNATYQIEGEPVTLTNGRNERPAAPGSAMSILTQAVGSAAIGDLNGDGQPDSAFLLTQDGGGSGTFYYLAAAVQSADGVQGSSAVWLGDRIQPQALSIRDQRISVQFLDRKAAEPMSAAPTVLQEKTFQWMNGILVEEIADAQWIGRTWIWQETLMNNDTRVAPQKPDAFTLTFSPDGTVSGSTDCNSFSGTYTLEGNQLRLGPLAATMMFCENSQQDVFLGALNEIDSYLLKDGQLILLIRYDSGSMIFR